MRSHHDIANDLAALICELREITGALPLPALLGQEATDQQRRARRLRLTYSDALDSLVKAYSRLDYADWDADGVPEDISG